MYYQSIKEFLFELLQIKSTADNRDGLVEAITLCKNQLDGFTIETFDYEGKPSLLAYATPQRPSKFDIILNGHVDVVPADNHQFAPREENNKLYARGAMDMKTSVAIMIAVFKQLSRQLAPYTVGIQIVTDEEVGGFHGTGMQAQSVYTKHFIAGEASNLRVNNQSKGLCWVKCTVQGTSAHGAYPWRGDNALEILHQKLGKVFSAYPTPKQEQWCTALNLAKIETPNETFNKVPNLAVAWIDCRYIQGDMPDWYALFGSDVDIEICAQDAPHFTDPQAPVVKELQKATKTVLGQYAYAYDLSLQATHGASDARFYTASGADAVCFGPIGDGLHGANEWVDIPHLDLYGTILHNTIVNLASSSVLR